MSLEAQPLYQDPHEKPFEIESHASRLIIQRDILLQIQDELKGIDIPTIKALTVEYRNLIHSDIKEHEEKGDHANYLARYEAADEAHDAQEQEAILNEIKGRLLQTTGILN